MIRSPYNLHKVSNGVQKSLILRNSTLKFALHELKFAQQLFNGIETFFYPTSWLRSDKPPEMEFKEFESRFKSAKTRFKLSAGLNLERFDTILSGTNHI